MRNGQPSIRAREFLSDVRAGVSDSILQRKYALPPKRFYVYKAMALDIIAKQSAEQSKDRRKINAKLFLADIRCGMDDDALMIKYDLLPRHLQNAFRQIINAGLITPLELSNRLKITKSQVREAFVEMGKAVRELD